MGRNNQPRRGFSRGRSIDTREIAIRFLIISEDTKSSTEYFKALIKEVQAACSGSEVVGIAKDSVVQGCGMSTTRLLEEAKSIRSRRQIPFDRCWLVFDKQQTLGLMLPGQMKSSNSGISSTSGIRTRLSHEIGARQPLRQK